MASKGGPDIVENGLTLFLDASNIRSYPGSGTTWSDLSGNGNNGTLTNGPTFSAGNLGSIVFDGTNDYVDIPYNPQFNFSTGVFTVEIWVNFSSVAATTTLINTWYTQTTGWIVGLFSGKLYVGLSGDDLDIGGTTTILTNTWYQITLVGRPSSYKLYLNGNQEGSTYTGATSLSVTGNLRLGVLYFAAVSQFYNWFNGRMSLARIYDNRELTASEILQNYNATKSRFGR